MYHFMVICVTPIYIDHFVKVAYLTKIVDLLEGFYYTVITTAMIINKGNMQVILENIWL